MLWPQPPCSNLKVPLRCCGLHPPGAFQGPLRYCGRSRPARILGTPPILRPQGLSAHPRWRARILRPQGLWARSSDPSDLASRAALGAFQRPLRSCDPSGGRPPATPAHLAAPVVLRRLWRGRLRVDQTERLRVENRPISDRAARVHAHTSISGRAAKVGLLVGNFCTLSMCLPFSRKWAQHWEGLQRHLGSGIQLPILVQIEVRFHLFIPCRQ